MPDLNIKSGRVDRMSISDKNYVVILFGPEMGKGSSSDVVAIWADHAGLAGFARLYFEYLLKDSTKAQS